MVGSHVVRMVLAIVLGPFVAVQYHFPFGSDQIEGFAGVVGPHAHRSWRIALFVLWYLPLLLSPPLLLQIHNWFPDSPRATSLAGYLTFAYLTLVPVPFVLFPHVTEWKGWSCSSISHNCNRTPTTTTTTTTTTTNPNDSNNESTTSLPAPPPLPLIPPPPQLATAATAPAAAAPARQATARTLTATPQIEQILGLSVPKPVVSYDEGRHKVRDYHITVFLASRVLHRTKENIVPLVALVWLHLIYLAYPFGESIPWQGAGANTFLSTVFRVVTFGPMSSSPPLQLVMVGVVALLVALYLVVHAHYFVRTQDLVLGGPITREAFRIPFLAKVVFKPEPILFLVCLFIYSRTLASILNCEQTPSPVDSSWRLGFNKDIQCYTGFHAAVFLGALYLSILSIPLILCDAFHVYFGELLEFENIDPKYSPQLMTLEKVLVLLLGALSVTWKASPSRRLWVFKGFVMLALLASAVTRSKDWRCLLPSGQPLEYGKSGVFLSCSVAWIVLARLYFFTISIACAIAAQTAVALNDADSAFPTIILIVLCIIVTGTAAAVAVWWIRLPTPFEHHLESDPPLTFYQYQPWGGIVFDDDPASALHDPNTLLLDPQPKPTVPLSLRPQSMIEQRAAATSQLIAASTEPNLDSESSSCGSDTTSSPKWPDPPMWF